MKTRQVSKMKTGKTLPDETWDLKLYIINRTPKSVAALTNLKAICHEYLEDKCRLSIIDIGKHPQVAKESQIVAVPTLVKAFPLPAQRVIGDLSDTERVLAGLHLHPMN